MASSGSPPKFMRIKVKTYDNRIVGLLVNTNDTMGVIKKIICLETAIYPAHMQLVLDNEVLPEKEPIGSLPIGFDTQIVQRETREGKAYRKAREVKND